MKRGRPLGFYSSPSALSVELCVVSSVLLWCARVRVWCVVASAVMLSGVGCVLKRQHMGFNEDVVLGCSFPAKICAVGNVSRLCLQMARG